MANMDRFRDLEERTLELEQTCPGVRSVVNLLVTRLVSGEASEGCGAKLPEGYGLEWLEDNGFADAVEKLFAAGLVDVDDNRVLLKRPEQQMILNMLTAGLFKTANGKNCVLPGQLNSPGFLQAVKALLLAGTICRTEDPLLGRVFVLPETEGSIK